MLRDNWPVIDWREPIGIQEMLEGRSSHNGEFSMMSRSRSQGTEVTTVTGAFSNVRVRLTAPHTKINSNWIFSTRLSLTFSSRFY